MATKDTKITYSDGSFETVKAGTQSTMANGKTVSSINGVSVPVKNSSSTTTRGNVSNQTNQTNYLNGLASNGDAGQQIWANSQLNEISYLTGLISTGDSSQQSWASEQLQNYITPSNGSTTTIGNTPLTPEQIQRQSLEKFNAEQVQSQTDLAKAQADKIRDEKIAEIESNYQLEVAEGKISVREAEDAFNKQKAIIEQQYYQDSQRTKVYSEDMGIANSQQMVGLMQGDNARKNTLVNSNMSDRDMRIATIKDRLTAVLSQENIAVANANAGYNSDVAIGTANAQVNGANNMFNLGLGDYQAEVAQGNRLEEMGVANEYQIQADARDAEAKVKQMILAGQISATEATVAFERQLEAMAIQHGYSLSEAYAGKSSGDGDDGYLLSLTRKAAGYGIETEGLSEAAIQRKVYLYELTADGDAKAAAETFAKGKPTKPTKGIFNSNGNILKTGLGVAWADKKYNDLMAQYKKDVLTYNASAKYLGRPTIKE